MTTPNSENRISQNRPPLGDELIVGDVRNARPPQTRTKRMSRANRNTIRTSPARCASIHRAKYGSVASNADFIIWLRPIPSPRSRGGRNVPPPNTVAAVATTRAQRNARHRELSRKRDRLRPSPPPHAPCHFLAHVARPRRPNRAFRAYASLRHGTRELIRTTAQPAPRNDPPYGEGRDRSQCDRSRGFRGSDRTRSPQRFAEVGGKGARGPRVRPLRATEIPPREQRSFAPASSCRRGEESPLKPECANARDLSHFCPIPYPPPPQTPIRLPGRS